MTEEQKKKSLDFLPKHNEVDPEIVGSFIMPMSWNVTDPKRFLQLMKELQTLVAPGVYFGDNLFTWGRNNSFLDDAAFRAAWEKNIINDADKVTVWRRYIQATAAYHCAQLEGDFVECGVYSGTGIKTIVDYLGGKKFPKTFWGYDTFDYNPVSSKEFPDQQAGFYEKIQQRFEGYDQVKLVKGLIPEVLAGHPRRKISFLHIDLNNAVAEVAALEALFDLVVPGGFIVLDDYEWAGFYRGQKIAEDKFFSSTNYRVMPLPTGQGIVIKR